VNERAFVDPMAHSSRLERVQVLAFGLILFGLVCAIWIKWYVGEGGEGPLRLSLMMSSVVVAAFFAGFYMMKRTRRELMARRLFIISDEGIRSLDIGGEVSVSWAEVLEVKIGTHPSRGRTPDVLIRTEKGSIGAFMRWRDKDRPMPEPSLISPGSRFIGPDGAEILVTPETSELVLALVERVPPDKVTKGVLISI